MNNTIPVGAYVGTPAANDLSVEDAFEAQYAAFTSAVGAAPQVLDTYLDNSSWSNMLASAQWDAQSFAASPVASQTTPVVAMPMAVTSDAGESTQQMMAEISSGAEDAVITGIVQAWQQAGFSTIYLRPGYEMDGNYMPWSMGDTTSSVASWVSAFQHISEVAKSVAGENVQMVWNPAITNNSTVPVQDAYPGNQYVDVIGLDIYNSVYPFDLTDWTSGGMDSSMAQWQANPANQAHYWNDPAGSQYDATGNADVEWGLQQAMQFAVANGKEFAIPETGVGYDGANADSNDAALPEALTAALTAPGASQVAFVNVWDMWNWQFSGGAQPATAAGFAQLFSTQVAGQQSAAAVDAGTTQGQAQPVFSAQPGPVFAGGSGPDTAILTLSEDAWQGDAQFVFAVNGVAQNDPLSVTALQDAGQVEQFAFAGDWGGAQGSDFSASFVNDAYGGTPQTDRNLYVQDVSVDGQTVIGPATLWSNGSVSS